MIRTLLGLIRFDSGRGEVLGMDARAPRWGGGLDIRQAVGFVPEDECLFPSVVGIRFVAYCRASALALGMTGKDALQRSHEVLDYVGLGEARYRKVDSYSTGMKQRIKIASAIVHDPKLLVLDEPTNGMDPAGREDVLELARDLARNKGMSLLFSSHLLPDVEAVCDHVMVLGRGKLLASGRIGKVIADAARPVGGPREGRPGRLRGPDRGTGGEGRAVRGPIARRRLRPAGRRSAIALEVGARRRTSRSSPPAPRHEHSRRGLHRNPWRRPADADLRSGISTLEQPALEATP